MLKLCAYRNLALAFGQVSALEQVHDAASELGVSRGSVSDLQVLDISPKRCSS